MEKPSIFKNPIDHPVRNNDEVFHLKQDDLNREEKPITKEEKVTKQLFGNNIRQKINTIFSSPSYIYKADVEIKTKQGTIQKRIIGMQGETLITMDNTTIPFSDIEDIRLI